VLAQDGGASSERGGKMRESAGEVVLLDMDGTLLDTEKVCCESLLAALTALGYTDGIAALRHSMIAIPGPECEIMLLERHDKNFPPHPLRGGRRDPAGTRTRTRGSPPRRSRSAP
jgi:beta-phosphoglucomutase-like phosphatase (HAD superfamily)